MDKVTKLLTEIARKHLGFETLETRRSDSFDFKGVAVWTVKAALEEAYWHGIRDADPNGYEPLYLQYEAVCESLRAQGFHAINGHGKGGLWVRNPDMTKPPFVDENCFISFSKAKRLFGQ